MSLFFILINIIKLSLSHLWIVLSESRSNHESVWVWMFKLIGWSSSQKWLFIVWVQFWVQFVTSVIQSHWLKFSSTQLVGLFVIDSNSPHWLCLWLLTQWLSATDLDLTRWLSDLVSLAWVQMIWSHRLKFISPTQLIHHTDLSSVHWLNDSVSLTLIQLTYLVIQLCWFYFKLLTQLFSPID